MTAALCRPCHDGIVTRLAPRLAPLKPPGGLRKPPTSRDGGIRTRDPLTPRTANGRLSQLRTCFSFGHYPGRRVLRVVREVEVVPKWSPAWVVADTDIDA